MFTFARVFDSKGKTEVQQTIRDSARRVQVADVSKAVAAGQAKFEKLEGSRPGPLGHLWDDLKTLIALIADYTSGRYREIPWTSIAMITAAVLYFVCPFDLIPDLIPGVGYIDDAFVISMCISALRSDIAAYRDWRRARSSARVGR